MSYVVKCPGCGQVLGSGHVYESPEGEVSLNFQVNNLVVPPEQVAHLSPPTKPEQTGGS